MYGTFELLLSHIVERIFDPLGRGVTRKGHHIKAARRQRFKGSQILARGGCQFLLLGRGNAGCRTSKVTARAQAYFDKNPRVAILHDEIDFTKAAAPVARNTRQTLRREKAFGALFGRLSEQGFQHLRQYRA